MLEGVSVGVPDEMGVLRALRSGVSAAVMLILGALKGEGVLPLLLVLLLLMP